MTTLSYFHGGSGAGLVRDNSGYVSTLRGFASRLANTWRHHRDELELENLPFDVRKDIGFPSTDEEAELTSNVRKSR